MMNERMADVVAKILHAGSPAEVRAALAAIDAAGLGAVAWEHLGPRAGAGWHDADGWPTCECTACGCCGEPAEAQDEGVAVCAVCADYTVDADGEVVCAGCTDRVERVTESCGAGGQTRTYLRLREVRQ